MIEKYFPNELSKSLTFKAVILTCVAFFMLIAFKSWIDLYANDEISHEFEFANIYLDELIARDNIDFAEVTVGEMKSATVDINSISDFSATFTVQFIGLDSNAFYFDLEDFYTLNNLGTVNLLDFDGELSNASLATIDAAAASTAVLRFNFAPFEGREFNATLRLTDEFGATRDINARGLGLGSKWEFVDINDLMTVVTSLNLTEDEPQALGVGTTIGLALKNTGNKEANPQVNYDFFDVAVGDIAGPFNIARRVDADGSLNCDEVIFPGELCYMSFSFLATEDNMGDGETYKIFTDLFDFVSSDGNGLSLDLTGTAEIDSDFDIVTDSVDNCPYDYNLEQSDTDQDGVGDLCDFDSDNDGVVDDYDVCDGQNDTIDLDYDNIPDCIDPIIDTDQDGIADSADECMNTDASEISQVNVVGCGPSERDTDGDIVIDTLDQCEGYDDAIDVDLDSVPDACDALIDSDFDMVADSTDNCPDDVNALQEDDNTDGVGDSCQSVWDFQIGGQSVVAYRFEDVLVNQFDIVEIDIVNIGYESSTPDVDILEISVEFTFIENTCGGLGSTALNPSESCNVTIQFMPIDSGTELVTLAILADDGGSALMSLTGTGVDDSGGDSDPDTDGDGLNDSLDFCDNTPLTEIADIDSSGCSVSERDSDSDGITDNLDQCEGHDDLIDADQDSIPDACDSDVNTGEGGNSDQDADDDGVIDAVDVCANTTIGAVVNTNGCSTSQSDSDSDGIKDNIDQCPSQGGSVDVNGCPIVRIKGGSGANYNLLDDLLNVSDLDESTDEDTKIETSNTTLNANTTDDLTVDSNNAKSKVRRTLYNSGRLQFDSDRNLRFTDITDNIYAKYIEALKGYKNNLGQYAISGENNTENGTKYAEFKPDSFITRLAAMKIALVMNGYNIENRVRRDGRVFYDIPSEKSVDEPPIAWIRSVVHSAYSAGIINGDDGISDYDKYATRAEVLNMFANAAKVFDGNEYDVDKFDDVDGWVTDLIGFLEDFTSIEGRTDNLFMPYAFAKRSEAVKFAIDIAQITSSILNAPQIYDPISGL